MKYSDLVEGRDYAWLPTPKSDQAETRRIRYLGGHRAANVKIRWVSGDFAGLEEWLPTRTLLCRWGERRAFFRDRERVQALAASAGEGLDRVVEDAISLVLESTCEESGFQTLWLTRPERAHRLWDRADLPGSPLDEPGAFVDRDGWLRLGWRTALRFALAFAAHEPDVVLQVIQEREDRLRAEAFLPGGRHAQEYLRTQRPSHALARQWTGSAEVDDLRAEVLRLRQIAETATRALDGAGLNLIAGRLRRELRGR